MANTRHTLWHVDIYDKMDEPPVYTHGPYQVPINGYPPKVALAAGVDGQALRAEHGWKGIVHYRRDGTPLAQVKRQAWLKKKREELEAEGNDDKVDSSGSE